jgi:hypothetical protein
MKRCVVLFVVACFLAGAASLYAGARGDKIITIHGSEPYLEYYDEDTMASDSASGPPSQQSVKAYVDTQLASAVSSGVQVATVTITNAQLLTLETPITLVAAPGAGYFLEFVGATLVFDYGTVQCAEPSDPDDLVIQYNTSGLDVVGTWQTTGFITSAADVIGTMIPVEIDGGSAADLENLALEIENSGTNYTGCAGSELTVHTSYIVHATGL